MGIYDFILQYIKDIRFDSIQLELHRMNVIEQISEKVVKLVDNKSSQYKTLNSYLK